VNIKYVFVAAAYRYPDPFLNARRAIEAADKLSAAGYIPFVPHLDVLWHFVTPREERFWREWNKAWLRKCDAVVRLDGESEGADDEVEDALMLGLPVFEGVEALVGTDRSTA